MSSATLPPPSDRRTSVGGMLIDGDPRESPLLTMERREVGGVTTVILGIPGVGKSALAYRLAHRRLGKEMLWVRGNTDDSWWWLWRRQAVVWVPRGSGAVVVGLRGRERLPVDADVREYSSLPDLLAKAEEGRANVVYFQACARGVTAHLEQWLDLLEAVLDRGDRVPQLILDDEAHVVAPEGAGAYDGGYQRVKRLLAILADARRAEVSYVLAGHQAHDLSYAVLGKAHYTLLLPGARVPSYLDTEAVPQDLLRRIHRGQGVAVGGTAYGLRWEQFDFGPPPPREYSVVVQMTTKSPPLHPRRSHSIKRPKNEDRSLLCEGCGRVYTSWAKRPQCPECGGRAARRLGGE